jgi:hypothetical protein
MNPVSKRSLAIVADRFGRNPYERVTALWFRDLHPTRRPRTVPTRTEVIAQLTTRTWDASRRIPTVRDDLRRIPVALVRHLAHADPPPAYHSEIIHFGRTNHQLDNAPLANGAEVNAAAARLDNLDIAHQDIKDIASAASSGLASHVGSSHLMVHDRRRYPIHIGSGQNVGARLGPL